MALNYGFFNAELNTTTGTYDRTYEGDDLNSYFLGLISQNGVIKNVADECEVSIDVRQFVNYQFGEKITVNVLDGRAMVNGHWVRVAGNHTFYIDPPDITERYDKISLRCREHDRDVYVCVERGDKREGEDNRGKNGKLYPVIDGKVQPVGQTSTDKGVIFEPDEDGLIEIVLAYILVPDSATEDLANNVKVINQRGTGVCPWISHLIQDPNLKDLDNWLAGYTNTFGRWLEEQMSKGQLDVHVDKQYEVVRQRGVPMLLKKSSTDEGSVVTNKYDVGDFIEVFYDGLRLVEGEDWEIRYTGTDDDRGVLLDLFKLNKNTGGPGVIPDGHEVVLTFLKKTAYNIPPVDSGGEKY